ncbi:MAG: glycosyltransferase family 9 protein [Paludibacteraceae bacterium]|nr:glycosyltransferase family 9 protein [Paludibacteraceae bacterium]
MTYLVLRLTSIGNIAMTVPVISSVSKRYPEDTFVVVGKKDMSAAFTGLDNVIFHQAHFQSYFLRSLITLYQELKEYSIDAIIDLQDNTRTRFLRLLFRFDGVKAYTIDYGRWEKRLLTLHGAKHARPLVDEFTRYANTFRKAGLESDTQFDSIPVDEQARQAVQSRFGEKQGHWIGVAPFAKSRSNILPYRVTKQVIGTLSETPDTQVFLFGAGQIESEMLRQWCSLFPKVTCVAGQLPLEQELELMRTLDIMVCQDSANQHLCSLVGLQTLSIWCATHPYMGFTGWKQSPDDIIQIPELACRPCSIHGTSFCRFGNFACQRIAATTITQRIFNKLNNE